jgi:hypothetical protein
MRSDEVVKSGIELGRLTHMRHIDRFDGLG